MTNQTITYSPEDNKELLVSEEYSLYCKGYEFYQKVTQMSGRVEIHPVHVGQREIGTLYFDVFGFIPNKKNTKMVRSRSIRKRFTCHVELAKLYIPNTNDFKHVRLIDGDFNNLDITNIEWCICNRSNFLDKIM